jgi:uncharacterized membrane protein
MNYFNKKNLALTIIFAMLYASLTIVFSQISFEVVQFRIADCLTVLPIFSSAPIFGTTIGCIFGNLYGLLMIETQKTMIYGPLFGSFATFLASYLTYLISKSNSKPVKYLLGPLPPVIVKAIIIGGYVTYSSGNFIYNALNIGFGEFVVCYLLGIPLIHFLYENDFYKKIFNADTNIINK